ncbi:MAG TPA: hypothetical protein VGH11_07540 [Jatrophihabitans sp.]
MSTALSFGTADQVADFAPMAERAVSIDEAAMIRFRTGTDQLSGFVRLPYDVLAGRSIAVAGIASCDVTVSAAEFLAWLDSGAPFPQPRDAHWLAALPPRDGWQRIEMVPDGVVRDVVRSGASLAKQTDTRSAQQALVTSVVLTARSEDTSVDVPLGALSGLTRMGFLPHGASAAVDVATGWTRVTAPFGSTFISTGSPTLGLLNLN